MRNLCCPVASCEGWKSSDGGMPRLFGLALCAGVVGAAARADAGAGGRDEGAAG